MTLPISILSLGTKTCPKCSMYGILRYIYLHLPPKLPINIGKFTIHTYHTSGHGTNSPIASMGRWYISLHECLIFMVFISREIYPFSHNHGSGKLPQMKGNDPNWRYIHFSWNHDYGRKGNGPALLKVRKPMGFHKP